MRVHLEMQMALHARYITRRGLLDGPFVGPAKRAPFRFSESDPRMCIAVTNAEQGRLESSRAKRLPVIAPVEKAQQRASKKQRI